MKSINQRLIRALADNERLEAKLDETREAARQYYESRHRPHSKTVRSSALLAAMLAGLFFCLSLYFFAYGQAGEGSLVDHIYACAFGLSSVICIMSHSLILICGRDA